MTASKGRARLGSLHVDWSVPDSHWHADGGLSHLPREAAIPPVQSVAWDVRRGTVGSRPDRFDAFYGEALVRVADPDEPFRVWSPSASFEIDGSGVRGHANDACGLASSIALHALAAYAGLAHLHAALLGLEGRHFIAPGGSGAGKTTLSLALAAHGGALLADDTCYVDADREAWPVRRPPRATARTAAVHPATTVLGPAPEGRIPKLELSLPPGRAHVVRADAVLLPTIQPTGVSRIVPLDPTDVFPALVACSAFAFVPESPRRDAVLDTLAALARAPGARLLAGPDALERPALLVELVRDWLSYC